MRNERGRRQPAAPITDIKFIILFPFLFIIRIIILCGVIIGEKFRSDKRLHEHARFPQRLVWGPVLLVDGFQSFLLRNLWFFLYV